MKHPNQATLALHAGGDLGYIARWRVERHLAGCDRCSDEVDAFAATREIIPELSEIPEVAWNRLAAEMQANIRLGLEAGKCVSGTEPVLRERRVFTGFRAAVALAGMAALLVTGLFLQRPRTLVADDGLVIQATEDGIQVRRGGQALQLNNPQRNQPVTYAPDAQGSMRARSIDPETGYVTINSVYAE